MLKRIHIIELCVLVLAVCSLADKKEHSKFQHAKDACLAKAPFKGAKGYACNGLKSYVSCDTNSSLYALRGCNRGFKCTESGWLSHPPCGGKKEKFPVVRSFESLCKSYAQTDVYDGFVYLSGNTTHYLRCYSGSSKFFGKIGIHEMRKCPKQTRCSGPSGQFTTEMPCKTTETIRTIDEVGIANATTNLAESLCQQYTPTGAEDENGYVCFESNSSKFLQCSNISSTIFTCANNLVCSYPIGEWITDNTPCGYGSPSSGSNVASSEGSESASESQGSSEQNDNPRELCEIYMPPSANNTGFVCLNPNSPRFLECDNQTALFRNCAPGAICASPLGKWTYDNPCGYSHTSGSESLSPVDLSSSESQQDYSLIAALFCRMVEPQGAVYPGYVCLQQNSTPYVECLDQSSGSFKDCRGGTVCTKPNGEWSNNNPCGLLISSSSSQSASGSSIPSSSSSLLVSSSSSSSETESSSSSTTPSGSSSILTPSGSSTDNPSSSSSGSNGPSSSSSYPSGSSSTLTPSGSSTDNPSESSSSSVPSSSSSNPSSSSSSEILSSSSSSSVFSSSSNSEDSCPGNQILEELCESFRPNGNVYTGYVCLKNNSTQYLECFDDKLAVLRDCIDGAICMNPVGKWDTCNPCGFKQDSSSENTESSGSSSNSQEEAKELCKRYRPSDAVYTGYVCLEENSRQYLECFDETFAFLRQCAKGTICANPIGEWNINNPCDWGTHSGNSGSNPENGSSSNSKSSSNGNIIETSTSASRSDSGSHDLKEVCKMYMPSDATGAGYVCLEENSQQYLECFGDDIALMRDCAEGSFCSNPVRTWSENNPCGFGDQSSIISSSDSPVNLDELCKQYSGDSENAGFVCLNKDAPEYLRCYSAHNVSIMMPCPLGTRCTAEVNTWTENPPCSSGTSSSSSDQLTPEELCMKYVRSIYDFGYVCLEANATSYLRCYLAQGVSVIMDCEPGTACTATPGTLTTAVPCN